MENGEWKMENACRLYLQLRIKRQELRIMITVGLINEFTNLRIYEL